MISNEAKDEQADMLLSGEQTDTKPDADEDTSGCLFCPPVPRRYIMSFAMFISLFLVYCLRGNLSVALVAMASNHTRMTIQGHHHQEKAEFDWDSATQGHILSAFCYGYLLTQIPGGLLAAKFGGKRIFGLSLLGTALLTIVTPFLARMSVGLLFAVRVLEGALEGCIFPSMYALWSVWAPPLERSILATISHTGVYGGAVIGSMAAGLLCEVFGWASVFYSSGLMAVLWSIVWLLCIHDSPRDDPFIRQSELMMIESSLENQSNSSVNCSELPWLRIITSLPMIALTVSHVSEGWVFSTLHTGLPKFLNEALGMRISHAGLFSGTLYFAIGCSVLLGGQLSDSFRQRNVMSTTAVRKCFLVTGMAVSAVFLALSVTLDGAYSSTLLIILAGSFQGLSWATIASNHLDLAPRFSSVLFGITNTLATIPGIIAPLAFGYLTPNQTLQEWRIVFYIGAGSFTGSAIFYGIFGSGKLQTWSKTYEMIEEVE